MKIKSFFNLKIIGSVLVAMSLLLIFFSRTIYTANLPIVTAASPQSGKLNKLELSTGIVSYTKTQSVYAPLSGYIDEVLVLEGDHISEGQELIRMRYDTKEAERKLQEIKNSRRKIDIDLDNLELQLEKLSRYKNDAQNEDIRLEEVSNWELKQTLSDLHWAEQVYEDLRRKVAAGTATDAELRQAETNIANLDQKRAKLEHDMEVEEAKNMETYLAKLKERDKRVLDYQSDIDAANLNIKAKKLERESLALQEEPYQETLEKFEQNTAILSNMSGTITSLNVQKDERINENQLVVTLGLDGPKEIKCNITLENNFVAPGDTCTLSNSLRTLDGVVASVVPAAQNKEVTISIEIAEVTAGETFDVRFRKDSATSYTLVPNGALQYDSDGYFVYQIKRRDGMMGKEYYVDRLPIYIGDSDTENTAVIQGISFFEPIVLLSDKALNTRDTVTVANEGDFFES